MARGPLRRTIRSARLSFRRAGGSLAAVLVLAGAWPLLVGAAAPTPSPGSATIDGAFGEWDLAADHFSAMTSGSNPTRPVHANFYARYDCETEVLAGLVLVVEGDRALQTRPENAYFRIDGTGKAVSGTSGNDGTPPDFAWVNPDGTFADGFEASIPLAPGSYTLRVHILIADDTEDGYTSYDTIPRDGPLVLACEGPTESSSTPPSQSTPPSSSPSGSDEPIAGTPTPAPTGTVAAVVGTPRVTPPATDVHSASAASSAAGLGWIAIGIGLVALAVALAAPDRRTARRRG
jgi:hypothetical protein